MKLEFADAWPILPSLLLAALVVAAVVLAYRTLRGRLERRAVVKFAAWRIAAALLLLALLFEPRLTGESLRTEDLGVVVLLDRSGSMAVADSVDGLARHRAAADVLVEPETGLLPALEDDFDVECMAFDARVRPAAEGEVEGFAAPDGPLTDLEGALRRVAEARSPAETAAVVLLSDGAENAGGDAREAARMLGVPVHAVGFGQKEGATDDRRDLVVLDAEAPERVFAGNTVVVEATVRSTGYDLSDPGNARARVILEREGTELTSETVTFTESGAPLRVPLRFVPEGKGRQTCRVRMAVRGDEVVTGNNARSFTVNVLDRRASVLYFDATLRWEAKFLRDFLARDPAVDLTSVLHSGQGRLLVNGETHGADLSKGLPATAEGFGRFDVVILGDVEAEAIDPARLALLRDRVEAGGGLLTLGGYHAYGPGGWAGSPVAEVLPVFIAESDGQREAEAGLRATPEGRVHPVLSGLLPFFEGGDRPPLRGFTEVRRAKPGAQVLLTADAAEEGGPAVVLAAHRYGEGRVVSFTGDTTWVWFRSPALGGPDGLYARFWGQVLRWLLEREPEVASSGDPVEVFTDQPSYRVGETVRIRARVRNEDGEPVGDANLEGRLVRPDGDARITFRALPRAPGQYEATHFARLPGGYRAGATARRGTAEIGRGEAAFEIEDASVESERVDLDEARLMAIARISEGRYYHVPPKGSEIAAAIRGALVGRMERREIGLSNGPLFFLLFVGLLGTEWFLRRRRSLL